MNKKIRAALFDYGGVITKKQPDELVWKMANLLKSDVEVFTEVYLKFRPDLDRGVISDIEYWRMIMDNLSISFNKKTAAQLSRLDVKSWTDIDAHLLEFIKEIKIKYRIKTAVLSNMIKSCLDYLNKNTDIFKIFDILTFSSEHKIIKPEKEIYLLCAKNLGCKPEECLFIDDTIGNITAARKLGFHAIHYHDINDLKEYFR